MTHRITSWTFRPRVARIGAALPLDQIRHDAGATANRAVRAIDAWISEDQWLAGFPGQTFENAGLCWWRHS